MHLTTRSCASAGAAVLAAVAASLLTTGPASAAPASTVPAPTVATAAVTDASFVTMNQQSNLAEISLGTLAKTKGQDAATMALANRTITDHTQARTRLASAASSAKLTPPTSPNAAQLALAAKLRATPAGSFDLAYAQAQVTAHQQALATARAEQAATKNAQLKSYTRFYIPVATMHLQMAQAEVSKLGGAPNSVPAGSGGAASTSSSLDPAGLWAVGGGAVLVAAGAAVAVARRRSQPVR